MEPDRKVHNDGDELTQIRREIASQALTSAEQKRIRTAEIKAEVTERLAKRIPIRITPEMLELGIAKEILELAMQAENAMRLQNLCGSNDEGPGDGLLDCL